MDITLKKIRSGAITEKLGTYGFTPTVTVGGYHYHRSSNGYKVIENSYNDSKKSSYVVKGLKNDEEVWLNFEDVIDWGVVEAREEEARKIKISEIMKTDIKNEILFMTEKKESLIKCIENYKEEGLNDLEAFIETVQLIKGIRLGRNKGWIKIMIKKGYKFEDYITAHKLIN